jgi:hypothetical protein
MVKTKFLTDKNGNPYCGNLTQNRFRKDQFRNAGSYKGWAESDSIPGWGKGKAIL